MKRVKENLHHCYAGCIYEFIKDCVNSFKLNEHSHHHQFDESILNFWLLGGM